MTFLGGDIGEWEQHWAVAEQRQQEIEANGGVEPLPWVDEDDEDGARNRAVADWGVRRALAPRMLRRVVDIVAAMAAMAAALRGRFNKKIGVAQRRHQVMLKRVRGDAQQTLAHAETGYYIPPSFTLLKERPTTARPRRGRGKREHKDAPGVVFLPFDGSIRELFDRAADDLVLIGDAGMGKSTQLAKLAEALTTDALDELNRRGRVDNHDGLPPIPVLLSLSNYQGQPLEDWLVDQIKNTYDVAEQLSRAWLAGGLILPLLDGLDRVATEHRRECTRQIRRHRTACSGIVVTCRDRDLALTLKIGGTLASLEPPTRRNVQDYLAGDPATGTDAYADVRAALEADKNLWKLLRSPLMLNIIHHTYAGRTAHELHPTSGMSIEQRQRRIFDAYLNRMLAAPSRYSDEDTIKWLTWLSRQLGSRGEDVLYLDRLDDSWIPIEHRKLPRVLSRYAVQVLACGLAMAWLALGVQSGFISVDLRGPAALMAALLVLSAFQAPSSSPTSTGLVVTVSATSGAAMGAWVAGVWSPTGSAARLSLGFLVMGACWGMILRAASQSSSPLSTAATASISALAGELVGPWTFSTEFSAPAVAVVTLAYLWAMVTTSEGLLHTSHRPIEELRWKWLPSMNAPPTSTKGAIGLGLGLGMLAGLLQVGLFGIALGLVIPDTGWLLPAAVCLLTVAYLLGNQFEATLLDKRPRPNEGIRRSARYAVFHGSLNALIVGLLLSALITLADADASLTRTLFTAALASAMYGISRGFRFGGAAFTYHWTLRASLTWSGNTPRRYQHFLHDAEQRILLRRAGSGFAFPHQTLQEHLRDTRAQFGTQRPYEC
ncbi:NACHT domain-containing protein [Embleya sp. NPDC050154]|uniref:NACHT domain-containing protein n=1 Tax=Embleya sp. NPDC050154 TaxID=3363988 RepID=UPI0037B557CD